MKFTEERKEELRWKRYLRGCLDSMDKFASSHKRILYPHLENKDEPFNDRENYSYWKGFSNAIREIRDYLDNK